MARKVFTDDWREWLGFGVGHNIDLPVFDKFCNVYTERVCIYRNLLITLSKYRNQRCKSHEHDSRVSNIDSLINTMMAPMAPKLQELEAAAVFWFLAEVRAWRHGEPIRRKDFVAPSFYKLAAWVMEDAAYDWHCRRDDSRDLSEKDLELFYDYIESELLSPIELIVPMQLERALARKMLKDRVELSRQVSNK